MTQSSFDTWIRDAEPLSLTDTVFSLAAPNSFAKEWLETRYRGEIERALWRAEGRELELRVTLGGEPPAPQHHQPLPARRMRTPAERFRSVRRQRRP